MIFFSQIYLISIDGVLQYIPVARLFAWGEYREALGQVQLPLYPFLIAVVSKTTGNFELSGQIISIVASILAVIPLFLLGKYIFGETAAFWAGIFYLLNPEMLQRSVDVLKEGLLIFLLFSAVFLFYLFLSRRRMSWLVASSLLTLLAALTRVVSLMLIPVFIFWILCLRKKPFDVNFYKRFGYIFVVFALCSAVVIPLMVNVKMVTGQWDISRKVVTARALVESLLFDRKLEMVEVERGPFVLVKKIIKVYHPILFLFLLAGLIRRKAIPRDFFQEHQKKGYTTRLFSGNVFVFFYFWILDHYRIDDVVNPEVPLFPNFTLLSMGRGRGCRNSGKSDEKDTSFSAKSDPRPVYSDSYCFFTGSLKTPAGGETREKSHRPLDKEPGDREAINSD
jgi:4-amino-4-deoxy-L-arabinose transferase-like glycosyltransferase